MKKSDLEYFETILKDRKEQIIKNINDSVSEIDELRRNGAVDEFDIASITADSDLGYSLGAKQRNELREIESSLLKVKNGTYGICESCEENISMARLKAKPNVKLCITCQELSEKNLI
ncbi:MAG: RNA polymerase-binding protein DksA [Campylobacteraceae bacterium]|nr:RNA polymerase-binding protein DksA [Campylobacteraceae bacterium]